MPLYMDVHEVEGVDLDALESAHERDSELEPVGPSSRPAGTRRVSPDDSSWTFASREGVFV